MARTTGSALCKIAVLCLIITWALSGCGPAQPPAVVAATPVPTADLVVSSPTPETRQSPTSVPTASPTVVPSPTPVPFLSKFSRQPVAVMVDNHPSSRPQSGLESADVVYEGLTEGGVTRFMAVFGNRDAEVVGPIRSTRKHFIYLAYEYNAILAHIGTYTDGYAALATTGVPSLDGVRGLGSYWRSSDRYAPYNAYGDTRQLRALVADQGNGQLGSLAFNSNDVMEQSKRTDVVDITYSHFYSVNYRYSSKDGVYLRSTSGEPMMSATSGGQLGAKNVIVQFAEAWSVPGDTEGRADVQVVGQGQAFFFVGGKVIEGRWQRKSWNEKTIFTDLRGESILLNPGPTWINIVPSDANLVYN